MRSARRPRLYVYGPYPSGDPRKPWAVGAKQGEMGYRWTFGHEDRADAIAHGLRARKITPSEVDGLTVDRERALAGGGAR